MFMLEDASQERGDGRFDQTSAEAAAATAAASSGTFFFFFVFFLIFFITKTLKRFVTQVISSTLENRTELKW